MKSNLLLLVVLLVKTCIGFEMVLELCPADGFDLCNCKPPQDPEESSYASFADMITVVKPEGGINCLCLCSRGPLQSCLKDADCSVGYSCTEPPPERAHLNERVCSCPCDAGMSDPFCPVQQYSRCVMTGPSATCESRKQYKCSTGCIAPSCYVWEDDKVYEYLNPCYFTVEASPLSKLDKRWKKIGKHCSDVPQFAGKVGDIFDIYEGKKEYILDVPATTLLGLDFAEVNSNQWMYGSYFKPEPEPEGEPTK